MEIHKILILLLVSFNLHAKDFSKAHVLNNSEVNLVGSGKLTYIFWDVYDIAFHNS